jgi:hypothetical protein
LAISRKRLYAEAIPFFKGYRLCGDRREERLSYTIMK